MPSSPEQLAKATAPSESVTPRLVPNMTTPRAHGSVTDQLLKSLNLLDASSFTSSAERIKVKEALLDAYRRVQIPFEVAMDHTWTEPATTAAIKTLIDADFWGNWVAAGARPSNVTTLSKVTGIDAVLLRRLLRELAGQRFLIEMAADTFALTPYTRALAGEKFPSIYTFLYELNQPCMANWPKFAAAIKYINPTDPDSSNFHHWKGRDQTMFTMMAERAEVNVHFNNTMAVYAGFKYPWVDLYPSDLIAIHANKPRRALVVDIGGGDGHDLEKFRHRHPHVRHGSLILQDLPHVIAAATVDAPCVAQEHDFFAPQPVKGARAYYIHCSLHDWTDEKAVEILKNTAMAMERGYSRILIHEIVISESNAPSLTTLSDLTMMMCFSSHERTEQDWRNIIAKADLKVIRFWASPESVESIIEVELP